MNSGGNSWWDENAVVDRHQNINVSDGQIKDAFDYVKEAIFGHKYNDLGIIGQYVANAFNRKYTKYWNCIVGVTIQSPTPTTYVGGFYSCEHRIKMEIGGLLQISLFMAKVHKIIVN